MSRFFGGLGAGKGWKKFLSIPNPADLGEVISQLGLRIIETGPVPLDYLETGVQDYVRRYRSFVDAIASGTPITWTIVSALSVAMTDPSVPIRERISKDTKLKTIEISQPPISIMALFVELRNGKFLTNVGAPWDAAIGLVANFPKVVSYADEKHEVLHDTAGYKNSHLFDSLENSLKQHTRPLVIDSPDRTYRTRIRIAPRLCAAMSTHTYLALKDLVPRQ